MKALTFKKTLLASALLAAAGSATAATSVSLGAPKTTAKEEINVVTKVADIAAYETLIKDNTTVVQANEKNFLQINTDGAIFENDIITIDLTNAGLSSASVYKLTAVISSGNSVNKDEVIVSDVPVTVLNREFNPSGSVKTLKLRVGSGGVATGSTLYLGTAPLVAAATVDWKTGVVDATQGTGLAIELEKGLPAGSKATITASVDFVAANLTDITFGSADFASTVVGLYSKFTGAGTKFIDRAEEDLKLINGETTITAPGLAWSKLEKVSEKSVDLNFNGNITDKDIAIGHPADASLLTYNAKVVLPADCETVLVKGSDGKVAADAVTLAGAAMTKSTTEACTWTADSNTNGADIVVKLSGKDKLSDSSASATFVAKYNGDLVPAYDRKGTVYTLSGDVQTISGSSATLPYIYSFPGSGAFSYVKVDNSAAPSTQKAISLVVEGTIQETVAGAKPVKFKNYFLKDVVSGELGEFTGTDILDALITPRGDAAKGYEDTPMSALSKAKGYHMSVTLKPVSTGGSLKYAKLDGVNTSGIGRTPVKVIMNGNTLSSVTSAVSVVDGNVDTIKATNVTALNNYATCVQAVTALTDIAIPAAYDTQAKIETAGDADKGDEILAGFTTAINNANALQDSVLSTIAGCKTTHLGN